MRVGGWCLCGVVGVLALSACSQADIAAPIRTEVHGLDEPTIEFTPAEMAVIRTLSPLPEVPPDPTNRYANDPGAAALGHKLFVDASFSGPLKVGGDLGVLGESGKVACRTCHDSAVTADGRTPTVSLGTDFGVRKALPIVNSSFYRWSGWGGRFDSQWSLVLGATENAKVMNATRLQVVHLVYAKYKTDYEQVFGALDPALDPMALDAARFPAAGKPKAAATDPNGVWETMTSADQSVVNRILANFGKAVAAYLRSNVSRDSSFDRFVAGDCNAINPTAKSGLRLFLGKGACIRCHSGPNFSDDAFHNEGVPQTGEHVPPSDNGQYDDVGALIASPWNSEGEFSDDRATRKLAGLIPRREQMGQFRTKTLRNMAASNSYMHAGQMATLEQVVHFYATGGATEEQAYGWTAPRPASGTKDPILSSIRLSPDEIRDIVAFLKALDGASPNPR